MGAFFLRAALTGFALWVVTLVFKGIYFVGGDTKLERVGIIFVVAVIFGLVNAFIKPVVQILSIPLYIVTLGLFHLVINGFMIWLTAWITDHTTGWGLRVDHFWWSAIWAAILLSIVSWILSLITRRVQRSRQLVSALPPGRPLFGECARAFLGVLGLENPVAVPGLVVVRGFEIKRQALDSRLLRRRNRQRRIGRDALGVVVGGIHQLVRRHHPVDQSHRKRAFRVHHVRSQQQLHRERVGHLARQPHRGAAAGEQTALGLHHRESCLGNGDPDIGGAQQLESARDARAVYGGDDRLVDRKPVQDSMDGVGLCSSPRVGAGRRSVPG